MFGSVVSEKRHGDGETRRRGDAGTRRHGDAETRRRGDRETRGRGDRETRRHRDTETRRRGDTETRRHGDHLLPRFSASRRLCVRASPCPRVSLSPRPRISAFILQSVGRHLSTLSSHQPSKTHSCIPSAEVRRPQALSDNHRRNKESTQLICLEPSLQCRVL